MRTNSHLQQFSQDARSFSFSRQHDSFASTNKRSNQFLIGLDVSLPLRVAQPFLCALTHTLGIFLEESARQHTTKVSAEQPKEIPTNTVFDLLGGESSVDSTQQTNWILLLYMSWSLSQSHERDTRRIAQYTRGNYLSMRPRVCEWIFGRNNVWRSGVSVCSAPKEMKRPCEWIRSIGWFFRFFKILWTRTVNFWQTIFSTSATTTFTTSTAVYCILYRQKPIIFPRTFEWLVFVQTILVRYSECIYFFIEMQTADEFQTVASLVTTQSPYNKLCILLYRSRNAMNDDDDDETSQPHNTYASDACTNEYIYFDEIRGSCIDDVKVKKNSNNNEKRDKRNQLKLDS